MLGFLAEVKVELCRLLHCLALSFLLFISILWFRILFLASIVLILSKPTKSMVEA